VRVIGKSSPVQFRIDGVTLDRATWARRSPAIEQERKIAIYDLLAENHFEPKGSEGGPYHLILGVAENRLVFDVRLSDGSEHGRVLLSLTPFKQVLKDYFAVCESYYVALRDAPLRLEAIDMGRKSLHDDGANLLRERLKGKIGIDFVTARRLFTLICALSL
jgi:uncharacterized protein (UPF0262 family)